MKIGRAVLMVVVHSLVNRKSQYQSTTDLDISLWALV
jgi:hypothetical protein